MLNQLYSGDHRVETYIVDIISNIDSDSLSGLNLSGVSFRENSIAIIKIEKESNAYISF